MIFSQTKPCSLFDRNLVFRAGDLLVQSRDFAYSFWEGGLNFAKQNGTRTSEEIVVSACQEQETG
jgi:hypothetical protein